MTPEACSPQALDWFEHCLDPLISSDWLITETHSALSIKQRRHGLRPALNSGSNPQRSHGIGIARR